MNIPDNYIVVLDTKNEPNRPVAICPNESLAHMFAECYSYKLNQNAIYGLYGVMLMSGSAFVKEYREYKGK